MKKILKNFLKKLKSFLKKVGAIQTTILVSIVYLTVVGIIAIFVKIFRRDLLGKRPKEGSYWIKRDDFKDSVKRYDMQF